MEYQWVNADSLPQVMDLWDYCFEKKDDPFFKWYFSEYCLQDNLVLGGFDTRTGRLAQMLHLNPLAVQLRGKRDMMPYIVGVATAPEYRGQHLTRPLLQAAFERLRSQRVAFALLMPIYAGIYQPYGFAYCFLRRHYKLPLRHLYVPAPAGEITLTRVPLSARHFTPVYDAYAAQQGTMVLRGAAAWRNLLTVHAQEGVQAVLAERDGESIGYLFYTVAEGTFTAHELVALTADARRALLRFAAGHLSAATTFDYLAEGDDPTWLELPDQHDVGQLAPFMMARCVDPLLALSRLEPPQSLRGSLTLRLTDPLVTENNLAVTLAFAGGRLELYEAQERPDAALDIGAFAQLYLGALGAPELLRAGTMQARDNAAVALLDHLLPKQRCFANEYF